MFIKYSAYHIEVVSRSYTLVCAKSICKNRRQLAYLRKKSKGKMVSQSQGTISRALRLPGETVSFVLGSRFIKHF